MNARTFLLALLLASTFKSSISSVMAAEESITLSAYPGFNLLTKPLNIGDNSLNAVFPSVPPETQVLKFANNNYSMDIFDGSSWLDGATGRPSQTRIFPGQGFFLFNPASQSLAITLTGEPLQGSVQVCFSPGFSLLGSPFPRPLTLNPSSGFPRILEMQLLRYIRADQPGGPGYRAIIIGPCVPFPGGDYCWMDSATGEPVEATIPVGEGFFVFNPTASITCWTANFSVD